MPELSQALHDTITRLSTEGDSLVRQGQLKEAIGRYNEAWKIVPEPKNDWEASTWLLAAIGDTSFLGGWFKSGQKAFSYALQCPRGFGNPFIHLRLGQCELEQGNVSEAVEHLTRAYALEGAAIFSKEHPKYFEFLKSKISAPAAGGW